MKYICIKIKNNKQIILRGREILMLVMDPPKCTFKTTPRAEIPFVINSPTDIAVLKENKKICRVKITRVSQ